jgi:hypothetical protein
MVRFGQEAARRLLQKPGHSHTEWHGRSRWASSTRVTTDGASPDPKSENPKTLSGKLTIETRSGGGQPYDWSAGESSRVSLDLTTGRLTAPAGYDKIAGHYPERELDPRSAKRACLYVIRSSVEREKMSALARAARTAIPDSGMTSTCPRTKEQISIARDESGENIIISFPWGNGTAQHLVHSDSGLVEALPRRLQIGWSERGVVEPDYARSVLKAIIAGQRDEAAPRPGEEGTSTAR